MCISVTRLYKGIQGQSREEEWYNKFTMSENIVNMFDKLRSKELDNLTPDELYTTSKLDYRC
jgi:hypothetical protein